MKLKDIFDMNFDFYFENDAFFQSQEKYKVLYIIAIFINCPLIVKNSEFGNILWANCIL